MTFKQLEKILGKQDQNNWHQHPNGDGWVENTAFVAETAYVGPDAIVYGNAKVFGDTTGSDDEKIKESNFIKVINQLTEADEENAAEFKKLYKKYKDTGLSSEEAKKSAYQKVYGKITESKDSYGMKYIPLKRLKEMIKAGRVEMTSDITKSGRVDIRWTTSGKRETISTKE